MAEIRGVDHVLPRARLQRLIACLVPTNSYFLRLCMTVDLAEDVKTDIVSFIEEQIQS